MILIYFKKRLQMIPRSLFIIIDVFIEATFNNAVSSSVYKNTRNISNTTVTMDCKLRKRRYLCPNCGSHLANEVMMCGGFSI